MSLKLLSDRTAALTDSDDAFGHRDYASTVAQVVKGVNGPFTLGLFAPWGHGKTSILEEVADQLSREPKIACVIFDVWRYEGDALRRQFLLDLATQLGTKRLKKSFDLDALTRSLTKDVAENEPRFRFTKQALWVLIVRFFLMAAVAYIFIRALQWNHPFDAKTTATALESFAVAAVMLLASNFGEIVVVDQRLVTLRRVEDPDLFAERFKDLLESLKDTDKLVIGVDNLDRCAPDRVAEMLGTMKTFLEPTDVKCQVVFVVAADDEALRRHLLAQEIQRSAGTVSPNREPDDDDGGTEGEDQGKIERAEIAASVDEYLRKFFNGKIRIADLISADVRTFAREQLAASSLGDRLKGRESDAGTLIEIVSSALRRNPRRIKQFFNNVELRVRVIEARERASPPRIEPPISGDVLLIAKLAIIEDEFPDRYRELCANPRDLDRWHELAISGNSPRAWTRPFVSLLRQTRQIGHPNLAAFLTLKQSREELALTQYQDFVVALRGADYETLETILAEPETADGYLGLVRETLDGELQTGQSFAAQSVVRSAIEVDSIRTHDGVIRPLLERALAEPELTTALATVDPVKLLDAARTLGDEDNAKVISQFVDQLEAGDGGGLTAMERLSAVAPDVLMKLNREQEERVERAIKESSTAFAAYRPLVVAVPAFGEGTPVEAALAEVEQNPLFDMGSDALAIVASVLGRRGREPDPNSDRFTVIVGQSLTNRAQQGDESFVALAELASSVIGQIRLNPQSAIDLISQLGGGRQYFTDERLIPSLLLVQSVLRSIEPPQREQIAADWLNWAFDQDANSALVYLEAHLDELESQRDTALEHVRALASGERGDQPQWDRATRLLTTLPVDEASVRLEQAAERATSERAVELLNDHGGSMAHRGATAIEHILEPLASEPPESWIAQLTTASRVDMSLFSSAQLVSLRSAIVRALSSADQATVTQAEQSLRLLGFEGRFADEAAQALESLVEFVLSRSADLSICLPQIASLGHFQEFLEKNQRHRLKVVLADALPSQPSCRVELARVCAQLTALELKDRKELVVTIAAVGAGETDVNVQRALLQAAAAIAPKSGTGRKPLQNWLDSLEAGTTDQQALAAEFD
jgi:hypothetical protein